MSTMFSSNSSGGGAVVPPRRGGMRSSWSGVDAGRVELGGGAEDEVTARRHVGAHEQIEHGRGGRRVLDLDPAQRAVPGIHGGIGQLASIHLAESLVALDGILPALAAALELEKRSVQLGVGVGVHVLLLALARVGQLDPV